MPEPLTATAVLNDRLSTAAPLSDPAVALCLDDDPRLDEAIMSLRAKQRIIVGVMTCSRSAPGHVVAACDVVLTASRIEETFSVAVADPIQEAANVLSAIERNPNAATVLSDVLLASERLNVIDALHVESLAYSALLAGTEFRSWLRERPSVTGTPTIRTPVRVERVGNRLSVVLNQPERRNAYSASMRDALVEALSLAEADLSIERIELSGAGPSFCAGGDLSEFGTNPDGAQTHLIRTRGGAGILLHRIAPRAEAILHGHCIGAGIELPAFAGHVRVRGDASFRLPEVSMGLIPGAGGTVSIPRRIGRHRTFWLAVTGNTLDSKTARSWGLVDAIDSTELSA